MVLEKEVVVVVTLHPNSHVMIMVCWGLDLLIHFVGHGTHTIGTVVGSGKEKITGVAPGARWIACRGFNRGYVTVTSLTEVCSVSICLFKIVFAIFCRTNKAG
jgi:hypothetical protein